MGQLTRYGQVLTVMAVLLMLAGCQPQPTKAHLPGESDGGLPVHTIAAHPHRTVGEKTLKVINGVETWVSPWPVGKPGGMLRTAGIGGGPKTFNPWVSKDATSSELGGYLTAGLVTTNPYTGDVEPDLAKSVEVLPDKVTYRVTLRHGLRWSDGHPITVADVLFTWNTIIARGLGNASTRDNTLVDGKFPTVRQISPDTVEFVTAKPFVPFIRRLGSPIAPKHIFAPLLTKGGEAAFNASWGTDDAMKHPETLVSSGIWLVEQYSPATQQVVFKRNPRYAVVDSAGQQLPYLERLSVRFVNDMNAMALLFEQGQLDVYPVPGQYVAHVRHLKTPPFTLYNLGPSEGKTFLVFNLNARKDDNGQPLVPPDQARWFQNTHFRQAVDWAVNRDDMVANILKGVGQPAFTAESPTSPFVHPTLVLGHKRDLAKARELLTQGGFQWNAAKQLVDATGKQVQFELLTNSGNDQRENLGVMIAEDLAALGITVNFRPVEFNVLVGRLESGQWGAMIMGLGGGSPLEPHDGANVWRSDGALHLFNQRPRDAQGNVILGTRYPFEAETDRLFEQGAQTFEPDQRRVIYHRFQEVIADADPLIYLITPLSLIAVHERVQNVYPTPLGSVSHNLDSLWIKPTS